MERPELLQRAELNDQSVAVYLDVGHAPCLSSGARGSSLFRAPLQTMRNPVGRPPLGCQISLWVETVRGISRGVYSGSSPGG